MNSKDIERLLPREPIEIDWGLIDDAIKGQRILITGAAGSIGGELTLQIAKAHPGMLILVDQAESPLHSMMLTIQKMFPEQQLKVIVASITNTRLMENIFSEYRPHYVFHAAAYKHVPMMEMAPSIAIQNNCLGTRVIADLSVKYGVHKFVMISTDKAVNPTSVMGASKRICEIYCQALDKSQKEPGTQFVTTRFGNVLGSSGSVIPIFEQQIEDGGPVTVTHPDMERYFMLIPEACELVLEACTLGHGGEIFTFDMGQRVRIEDLAKHMIAMSGAQNIEITYIGLRDGEKLYEELLNVEETTIPTEHPRIKVAKVREYDFDKVQRNQRELEEISYTYDEMAVVRKMKEIVPEYKSQHSRFEIIDQ